MPTVRSFSRFTFPAILVFVIAGINVAGLGLYSGLGLEESLSFYLLTKFGWLWAIGWWLTDDLRGRRDPWLYCPGLILQTTWPFVLPYYLLKTRGRKALIPIASLVVVSIAASLIGIVIGVILTSY